MWFLKVVAIIGLLMAIGVGLLFTDLTKRMAYDKVLTFRDTCKLLELPTPAEDLTMFDEHSAFAGAGDLWNTFMNGPDDAVEGGLYLVNATEGTLVKLHIENRLPGKFVFHGIYYSQLTRRLYAINHGRGQSVIEVFDVIGKGPSLKHLSTVESPLFGISSINDVVEGVDGEIYVSEWQPFPFPVGGKKSPTRTLQETLGRVGATLAIILRIKTTRVFRCTLTVGCTVASSERFISANGLAVSPDRQIIFLNDPPAQMVHVMSRDASGMLSRVSAFETKHVLDNLEMQSDGKLSAGTMPLPYTAETICEDAQELSRSSIMNGREVGCGKSPGGLLVISLAGTGGKSFVDATQVDKLTHDGSLLSGVSAALRLNGKVVMSSPNAPGVLVCD